MGIHPLHLSLTLISWEAVRVYPANGSVPIAEKLLHLAGAAAVASMLPEVRRAIDPRRRYGARGRGGVELVDARPRL
jgi:hypothetical protein